MFFCKMFKYVVCFDVFQCKSYWRTWGFCVLYNYWIDKQMRLVVSSKWTSEWFEQLCIKLTLFTFSCFVILLRLLCGRAYLCSAWEELPAVCTSFSHLVFYCRFLLESLFFHELSPFNTSETIRRLGAFRIYWCQDQLLLILANMSLDSSIAFSSLRFLLCCLHLQICGLHTAST